MERLLIIAGVALVTYATRIAGFRLGRWRVPPAVDRFLAYIPVAVFAALIAPDLHLAESDMLPRLCGVVAAGLVVLRWRQLWAGLGAGMAVFYAAGLLLPP